jgi:uncharacterized protein
MYAKGEGVSQNFVEAHMWLNVASANSVDAASRVSAANAREFVAAKMTPAQIAEAQRLASEWKPK